MTNELKGVFKLLQSELIKANKTKKGYKLILDSAPTYGGYRLTYVNNENGGHYTDFNSTRLASKVMIVYIRGLLKGLEM